MQHSRQIAGQHTGERRASPSRHSSVAQVIDAVAALDAEREAHLLPQPVLIQGQRRTVDCFDGHLVHSPGNGTSDRHGHHSRPAPDAAGSAGRARKTDPPPLA
jgi:hypothetical protein